MAKPPGDGPRDESGSETGGGRDFTWLYGKNKGQEPPPDATRPIRQQPPPTAQRRAVPAEPVGPLAPTPAPAPTPGRGTSYGGRSSRLRRPRFWIRTVLVLLLVWVIFLAVTPFVAWNKVEKIEFAPTGDRPGDQPGTTYLLVGSDSRADLTEKQRRQLGTGNAEGQRTDTILLLHTGSGPNLLMSIPRDSIVDIPGRGTSKINAAFSAGGPELLTQTIESETGIRVDQYIEIGFGGFVDIVDAVNGITICPRVRMKDPLAKLDIKKGCQEAEGSVALGYARSRKLAKLGDIDRARRQREVISAIGSKVASPVSVINPFRYWNLNMAATQAVGFGEGSSPITALAWASAMTNVDGESGLTCGVPIADLAVNWDPERSEQMFQAIIKDDTENLPKKLCTATGMEK
ncbi:LCP family protein [Nocardioides salsibiostraticola]